MRKRSRLALAGAVVVVGLLLLASGERRGAGKRPARAGDGRRAGLPAAPRAAGPSVPVGGSGAGAVASPEVAAGASGPGAGAGAGEVDAASPVVAVVSGVVSVRGGSGDGDWAGGGGGEVTVRAAAAASEMGGVAVRVGVGGEYRLDVAPLLARVAAGGGREVVVSVDHPAYLPVSGAVRFDGAGGAARVDIALVPAVAARGRVLDENGQAVAGATVAAFLDRPGRQSDLRVDLARAGPNGAYRLRIPPGSEVRLVVAAPGHGPRITTLSPSSGPLAVEHLALATGATVSGRVTADGRPVEGVLVRMSTISDGPTYRLGDLRVSDEPGGPVPNRLVARTDAEGRYAFRGLPGRAYGMVLEIDGAAPGFALPLKREVEPPRAEVDFDVSGTALTLEIRAEGADPAGVRIWSSAASGGNGRHDVPGDGRVRLRARPGETYALRIRDPRFEEVEHRFTVPPAAREHVERVVLRPR